MSLAIGAISALCVLATGQTLPDVAIVAAASNTANEQTNTRFTDPRDKLMGTGLFNSVTIISTTPFGGGRIPTLEELQQYRAVLVWSNDSHRDSVALGNVLADYVDAGGGVVHAVFGNTSTVAARQLLGRWQDEAYYLIPPASGWQGTEAPGRSMGQILVDNHPIMEGVHSFFAFGYIVQGLGPWGAFRPNTREVVPGATKVALWDDGATLVVVGPNPRVVELGMHPVSSDVNALGYWDAATDGARLMANALLYAMQPTGCAADFTTSSDPNDPSYGVPDGVLDQSDFFYFLDQFVAGNLAVADLSGSTDPNDPGYGNPDGVLDASDLFYYLDLFALGCP
ncbi:MAG: hypothetical protein KIT24_00620 [Phycisphaeraceae bacterium]|nr:hypothetical protein [Phycisphaeraceae bacterium]